MEPNLLTTLPIYRAKAFFCKSYVSTAIPTISSYVISNTSAAILWPFSRYLPRFVNRHVYLYNVRDPINCGLVFVRYMWEKWIDSFPAWKPALRAIHTEVGNVSSIKAPTKGKLTIAKGSLVSSASFMPHFLSRATMICLWWTSCISY